MNAARPPAVAHPDGKDFVPTHRWVVFGHHFAAIAGPGPLVGPVLAAQFGYLPGLLWILIGATLGGAVHDALISFARCAGGGKSLGQMVREEVGPFAGLVALVSIIAIMVILLAVLALVVVKALADSPWGLFTIAATMPIAPRHGPRPARGRRRLAAAWWLISASASRRCSAGGRLGRTICRWARAWRAGSRSTGTTLAWWLMGYGFAASVAAGLAAARAARLSQHLHEDRHGRRARRRVIVILRRRCRCRRSRGSSTAPARSSPGRSSPSASSPSPARRSRAFTPSSPRAPRRSCSPARADIRSSAMARWSWKCASASWR